MKINIAFIIISSIFFISCIQNNRVIAIDNSVNNVSYDTIFAPTSYSNKPNCIKKINTFSFLYGSFISNFYEINQKIFIKDDSIAILKPFYTLPNFSDCFSEKIDKNALVIYNKKSKKSTVFINVLFADYRDVLQKLKTNKNGFIIYSEQGNSSKFFINIFISNNKIDSIEIESWGFKQYKKMFRFNNLQLNKFNVKIIDSLQERSY